MLLGAKEARWTGCLRLGRASPPKGPTSLTCGQRLQLKGLKMWDSAAEVCSFLREGRRQITCSPSIPASGTLLRRLQGSRNRDPRVPARWWLPACPPGPHGRLYCPLRSAQSAWVLAESAAPEEARSWLAKPRSGIH